MTAAQVFTDFLTHCPEFLFVADGDSVVLFLTDALAQWLGPEGRNGIKLVERIHPDDRDAFAAAWARIGGDATLPPFEFRLQGADGAYRVVSCNARRSSAGKEVHGSLRETDLELPNAKALQQKGAILRILEENLPIVVWAIDGHGTITHQAGKGLAQTGIVPGQFLGMNMLEAYEGQETLVPVENALKGKLDHAYAETYGNWWETWHVPVRNGQSEITGVVGVSLDVSEMKRSEVALKEKLALIERQQLVIQSLATPIVEVWDRVLTLPMLGVVDSSRVAQVMDHLLAAVSEKGARIAILDLTGVDMVDTSTANHLIKIIQAIRLLGAEGIITGIRPSVAATMVTLGFDLGTIKTLGTLRAALEFSIKHLRGVKA